MKKYIQLSVLSLGLSCLIAISCHEKAIIPEKEIAAVLLKQIDLFSLACNHLQTLTDSATTNQPLLQQAFLECRLAYKKVEWAAEYFDPVTAKAINGPPVQEVEESESEEAAVAYQVLE